MVEIDKILESSFNIVESNNFIKEKLDSFTSRFGAFKIIVVCERPNKHYKVIDGNKALKSYKKNKLEKVLCYNLGKIDFEYEIGYRILLNAHFERLDYISISEAISKVCQNKHQSLTMSNISGLPIKDVDRYKELLNFDWKDFLSKKIEPNQMDIFNIINQ
jgi:hypothetical protein